MVQRVFDWFRGLNPARQVIAVLLAALLLFLASYLISSAVLRLTAGGSERADTSSEHSAAAEGDDNGSASSESPVPERPDIAVRITSARWEGQKAVVEGTWRGDVSSVHCDLLEGGSSGIPTRWWDRSVGTQMDWSERAFTQEFVAAEEGEGGEPLDVGSSYGVTCFAWFAGGVATGASAPVEGTPPD